MSQTGQRPRAPGQENRAAADEHENRSTRARGYELISQGYALLAEAERQTAQSTVGATLITGDNCAKEFPGLTPRAYADAGRAGEFVCFKSGRKLAAKRADVEAWLASRRVQPRARKPKAIDPVEAYEALAARGAQ